MSDRRTAVYAGSFDPITNGHLDVAERGLKLFDRVVLAIGNNPNKKRHFPLEERMQILRDATAHLDGIEVDSFDGLLVQYCQRRGATAILRGLRALSDFDFEFQLGLANMDMAPELQTVFLLTDPDNIFISSSLVREIAANNGDVSRYLPPAAHEALARSLRKNAEE